VWAARASPASAAGGDDVDGFHRKSPMTMVDLEYLRQILAALPPMAVTVALHGVGMSLVRNSFERFGKPLLRHDRNRGARTMFMIGVVCITVLTHLSGVVTWAVAFRVLDLVPSTEVAMYYSMEYYTTLGVGVRKLPEAWAGFGGFEAMTGMLMFGWSTAVLAAVVQRMHAIDD
jgi:hypothetical protein